MHYADVGQHVLPCCCGCTPWLRRDEREVGVGCTVPDCEDGPGGQRVVVRGVNEVLEGDLAECAEAQRAGRGVRCCVGGAARGTG